MHPNNLHNNPYDFSALEKAHPSLAEFTFQNEFGTNTIDFASRDAVFHLNKALLKFHYNITDWSIPPHYLCPPIPGRADYIHHIADLLKDYAKNEVSSDGKSKVNSIKGLDIGVGANCIYPILGAQIHNWSMVGADINEKAVLSARSNVAATPVLKEKVEIRQQYENAHLFKGVIAEKEYFDFTMCNPPFHTSPEEATKGTLRKMRNLESNDDTKKVITLNFGGQANELWCNGGEALFIKRMIKQSVEFQTQVGWFTTLVSKKEHLAKIYKQLDKLKVNHTTINMSQGNKKSRIIAWRFS